MAKTDTQNGFSVVEVSIVIGVVAIIGALGWKFYDSYTNKTQTNSVSSQSAIDIKQDTLTNLAAISDIQKDALADKPGVTVVHVELEQNSADSLVYKAQLSDGTVTVYNARTGARLKSSTTTVKTSEVLPANFAAGIGFAKAVEIARAEKPTSKVYKIELELEGGVVVYSVRFTDKARVDVNAMDGTIVRTKAAKVENSATKTDNSSKSGSNNSNNSSSNDNSGSGSVSSDDNSSSHDSHSGSDNSGSGSSSSDDHDDDDLSDSDDDDDSDSLDDNSDNSGSGKNRD